MSHWVLNISKDGEHRFSHDKLQWLNHLHSSSLDLVQYANICLVPGSPQLGAALQMPPHLCLK